MPIAAFNLLAGYPLRHFPRAALLFLFHPLQDGSIQEKGKNKGNRFADGLGEKTHRKAP
jgi:hypothetical protein